MTRPRFDELIGTEVPAEERGRLRRAHDALVTAGPPPELPASLTPRSERPTALPFLRRRRAGIAALAAALGALAFTAGWLLSDRGDSGGFATDFVLRMSGTTAAPEGLAVLAVGEIDEAGNWPMKMTVTGLAPGRYELRLTNHGEPAASCGTFIVDGRTVVYLNAPFRLRRFDGWVVTRAHSTRVMLRTPAI